MPGAAPRILRAPRPSRGARSAASDLLVATESAATLHAQTASDSRGALGEARVLGFAEAARGVSNGVDLLGLVLVRLRDVRQGKSDRAASAGPPGPVVTRPTSRK